MINPKKLIILVILILIFLEGCQEKTNQSTKKILYSDNTNRYKNFDSLIKKFAFKNLEEFSFDNINPLDYYGENIKFHALTHQEFEDLDLCNLYNELGYNCIKEGYPKVICYSSCEINDSIYELTFLNISEGGYKLYLTTFKSNGKIISYGIEPIAVSFGDMGYIVERKTQKNGKFTFYTVHKEWFNEFLKTHSEILTKVNKEGAIIQSKKHLN